MWLENRFKGDGRLAVRQAGVRCTGCAYDVIVPKQLTVLEEHVF